MEGTRGIAEPEVLRDLMYRGPVFRTGEGGGRTDLRDGSGEVRDNLPQMNQLLALDGTTLDPPLGMTSFHSVSSPFLTKMHVPVRDRSSSRYSPTFL